MLLHFVTEPAIGPKERRLIRSHVMKGKNTGKSRLARKPLVHHDLNPAAKSKYIPKQDASEIKHISCPHQPLWNELSLTSYPYSVGPEKERFVYQRLWIIAKALYPPEFCTEVNLSSYVWFQYVLEDAAYFHCLLAICFSFTTHFGGPRCISPESLRHVSQAYRITNERLSGSEACSDQAIAVVTMLAMYQRMHHQQSIGLVHFQGLRRMVDLRGGLSRLASDNRALAQKPWRLALEFALQDGAPVSFSLDEVEASHGVRGFRALSMPCYGYSTDELNIDPTLLKHLSDIIHFTRFLNLMTDKTKLDPLDYSDAVCILLHRLLAYAPVLFNPRHCLPPLDNLIHLILVAIMTRLMPEYGQNQGQYYLLASRLRGALQQMHASGRAEERAILLWVAFVAHATILDDAEDETTLIKIALTSCELLKLRDWDEVKSVLCGFAWISVFCDKAGLNLWYRVKERSASHSLDENI